MDIKSIRIGRATNSSSSHSIILHPMNDPSVEKILAKDPISVIHDSEFGDTYAIRTPYDKAIYFLSLNRDKICRSNHEMLKLKAFLKEQGLEEAWEASKTFEVTSNMKYNYGTIPPDGIGISNLDWLKFLLSDAVSIIGEDQNGTRIEARLTANGIALPLSSVTAWRFDNGAIIGYNKYNGAKFRASSTPYIKSSVPELVDLKITDHCAFGCKFCYQGSTPTGSHAPLHKIETIFNELAELGVFEVALGGGETPSHPDFAKILLAGHDRGLSVNFTSYGTEWAKNDEIINAIHQIKQVGIGISVHTSRDIGKLKQLHDLLWDKKVYPYLIAQTVVGVTPYKTTLSLLKVCYEYGFPLLLLGYKTVGRGISFRNKQFSDENMRELVNTAITLIDKEESEEFHLSVDTAFLDQWGHILDEFDISHLLRASPEGKFSCYVDAVSNQIGPSSYAGDNAMIPLNNIKNQFALW